MTEGGIAPEIVISQAGLEKKTNVASIEMVAEATPKTEVEKPFDFKFHITDHSPRFADTGDSDKMRALYKDIKRDGIDQVRYDWDWNLIEANKGEINPEQIARFKSAAEIMKQEGLDPLIILSNPPKWAKDLYRENPEEFVASYKNYAGEVGKAMEATGVKPETVQVLNELNNPAYTPVTDMEVIGQLCDVAREAFPDSKIMVSLLAAAIPEVVSRRGLSEDVRTFLPKLKTIQDKFDKVAIDYYPGGWQRPISGEGGKITNLVKRAILPGKAAYKEMFAEMDLFKDTAEEVASWGKQYELGETGFPTKGLYWGNEQRQRYFYDSFFRHFKHLMVDFKTRGVPLPDKLGLYQAQNEPPRNFIGKLMRKTPYPEFDWGMRDDEGKRRAILQGKVERDRKFNHSTLEEKFIRTIARARVQSNLEKQGKKIEDLSEQELEHMITKRQEELSKEDIEQERQRIREEVKKTPEGKEQESRLSRIIHYMRVPMREAQVIEAKQDNQELQQVREELAEVQAPHKI